MKKLLALILALVMVISTISFTVLADVAEPEAPEIDDVSVVSNEYPEENWIDSADTSWYKEGETSYTISKAEELAGLAKLVNDGTAFCNGTFNQKTITLGDDIDLSDKLWTPIGGGEKNQTFAGIFEGNGKTISNVIVISPYSNVGLFGRCALNADFGLSAKIQNLTVNNAVVKASGYAGSAGAVVGYGHTELFVDKVNVTGDIDISGYAYVAAVVGKGYADISNCTVEAEGKISTLFWCAGGIMGHDDEPCVTIDNCRVIGIGTGILIDGGAYNGTGGIGGYIAEGSVVKNCFVKNVTLDGDSNYGGGIFCGNEYSAQDSTFENVKYLVDGQPAKAHDAPVADVNGTTYTNIDEAIANWTNGTTLTLLANVTLTSTVKIPSTEKRTLNLGEFTLTAPKSQNAIEIVANSRSSAGDTLIVNADTQNPGGITAGSFKACIYYKSVNNDRPIIKINNGVFNGTYAVKIDGAQNDSYVYVYDGIFNAGLNLNRAKTFISGGVFNSALMCSVDSTAYMLISGGKFTSPLNNYRSALNENKWGFGTKKLGTYDVDVYVDNDGYYVVEAPISEKPGKFEASVFYDTDYYINNATSKGIEDVNGAFVFSNVGVEKSLYYTDADVAFSKVKSGTINLYEDSNAPANPSGDLVVDCTANGALYSGNVKLGSKGTLTIKLKATDDYKGIVTPYTGYVLLEEETIEDGIKTIKFSNSSKVEELAVASVDEYSFMTLQRAIDATNGNGTATLLKNTTEDVTVYDPETSTYATSSGVVIDLNNFELNGSITVEDGAFTTIKNGKINSSASAVNVNNGGTAIIESGLFKTSAQNLFAVEGKGSLTVNDGKFSHNPSPYIKEGYESVYIGAGEYPYVIAAKKAGKIELILEPTSDKSVYDIKLKSADEYDIYEFVSAELTFSDLSETVGGGDMQYEITGITGKTTAQKAADADKENQYIISIPNGDDNSEIRLSSVGGKDGEGIVIGQVKFIGQGNVDFKAVDGIVTTTWQGTNLGRYYKKSEDTLLLDNADADYEIEKITRDVVVNVAYNHPLVNNKWTDNKITVTLKGGFGEIVGTDDISDGIATFGKVRVGRITVTLEAPGFRKYVYETTLEEGTDALVLNFWNNVKRGTVQDSEEKIEAGKDKTYAHNFLVGDIVMDYTVDEYDLAAVTSYYGTYGVANTAKYLKYDLNRDGNIDIIDVHYVLHTLNN